MTQENSQHNPNSSLQSSKGWILAVLALLSMASVLHVNILLPMLPRIGETFGVGPSALGWLLGAGSGVMALTAPWAGGWGDRNGLRRALLLGVGIETIGVVGQTLAPTFWVMVMGRVTTAWLTVAVLVPNPVIVHPGGQFIADDILETGTYR